MRSWEAAIESINGEPNLVYRQQGEVIIKAPPA
ncbi:hypothetical protein M2105_005921 [Paenibacillus sp. PastF-1]|nr:hypothetical protein [Paenibacillus sp. PastF-2]MDF9851448.1 hypothetical protein [Paenibacillus sp. PastM-2]MDF9858022.1 hypothetical protein [Paenibacillus sp. PastF-1]MDH6483290.1 hypothetical protein [Paenibacillus sp. PastH-2]